MMSFLKRALPLTFAVYLPGNAVFAKTDVLPRNESIEETFSALLKKTAHGTSSEERISQATELEKLRLYYPALAERILAADEGQARPQELARIGDLALALNRFDGISSFVARHSHLSFPVSLRAAIGTLLLRLGNLPRARNWMPSAQEISGIGWDTARYNALVNASALDLASGQHERALQALDPLLSIHNPDPAFVHLQRARIDYDMNHSEDALEELVHVPRSSASWFAGVIVGAWSSYRMHDDNLTLGELMSLHSPYLGSRYSPESYILESASLYHLCHYESSARSLDLLRDHYKDLPHAIERFRSQFGNRYRGVTALLNYARGQSSDPIDTSTVDARRVMDGVLQADPLTEVDQSVVMIDEESQYLDSERFKNLAASNRFVRQTFRFYKKELDSAKREAYRLALKTVEHRLSEMHHETSDALENALAIEVEIKTRVRDRLVTGQLSREKDINFNAEVKKGFEFWPFQGEFWRDEIGSYVFATTDVCSGGTSNNGAGG